MADFAKPECRIIISIINNYYCIHLDTNINIHLSWKQRKLLHNAIKYNSFKIKSTLLEQFQSSFTLSGTQAAPKK